MPSQTRLGRKILAVIETWVQLCFLFRFSDNKSKGKSDFCCSLETRSLSRVTADNAGIQVDKVLTSIQFPDDALQMDAIEVSCMRFNHQTNTLLFDAHATLV